MEIRINKVKFYKHKNWFFLFRKCKYIKGFHVRVIGLCIGVRKDNATHKLITKFKNR